MRIHFILITTMALMASAISGNAQQPVIPGDFADPSVIKVGNTYYAAGTSSEWAPHYPMFTSTDLVKWKPAGYVFTKQPEWTASSFWAPELFYYRNTFYVYYTARRKSDNVSCIGVATSKDPSKGFTDHGPVIEFGKEAIDAFIFNDDGQLYVSFKAYGLDKRPIEILGAKLSADGLKMEGEPFSMLTDESRAGLEGQVLLKHKNQYYLLYSAGGCCGLGCSYNVRVAKALTIKGPYVNYESNPILSDNENWKCPGHGTVVQTAADKYFYLYHAYSKKDDVFTGRQGMLNELSWNETTGWPFFKNDKSSLSNIAGMDIRDDFTRPQLASYWNWDFRHYQPATSFKNGDLLLTAANDTGNHSGVALTVRPYSGNYEMITEVTNVNASVKGLTIYGDANQSVGVGIKGKTIQVWEVRKNQRKVLKEVEGGALKTQLKMIVRNGYSCQFYFSTDGKTWKEIKATDNGEYEAKFLPPWDRSPRPGLIQYGKQQEPAAFSFFSLKYQ